MNARSTLALSCAVVVFLLFAGVIAFFALLYISLERSPIKGWQEGVHTPHPARTVSVSPEPSGTP